MHPGIKAAKGWQEPEKRLWRRVLFAKGRVFDKRLRNRPALGYITVPLGLR